MMIVLADHAVELTPSGAMWVPGLKLLCVADMHFEKGSFFSRFATFLPPYDSAETLDRLRHVIEHYGPEIVIAAGDSFHDANAAQRLPLGQRGQLNDLVAGIQQWYWLAGNHDPELPLLIGGARASEISFGGIAFRHETAGFGKSPAEVSGHYHPKVRMHLSNQTVSGPCFVQQGERLIMPAFGHYTGGLDIDSAAFKAVMPAPRRVYFAGKDKVYDAGNR